MVGKKYALVIFVVFLILAWVPVYGYDADEAWVFVSPDSSQAGFDSFIDSVDGYVMVSTYQIDSPRVFERLKGLLKDGKEVFILVEDGPVGGIPALEMKGLVDLQNAGAKIKYSGDDYRFYHGKYMVADGDSLLVSTENLGMNSYPPKGISGNRGWGLVVMDAGLAKEFIGLFIEDYRKGTLFYPKRSFSKVYAENTTINPRFKLKTFKNDLSVSPVIGPDDSLEKTLELIKSANDSLYIEQFYIYTYWGDREKGSVETTPNPLLEEAFNAARRGVEVRILMDPTWYVSEEYDPVSNLQTMRYVNEIARREGLDMVARLIDLDELGFEKMHTKGLVVDGNLVLLGSMNWNEFSARNNREVGLILEGDPAQYFEEVFFYDWDPEEDSSENGLNKSLLLLGIGLIIYLGKQRI